MKQTLTAFVDLVYTCGLDKRTLHFDNYFNDMFLSCRVPTFRGQKVVVAGVSHSCLLIV